MGAHLYSAKFGNTLETGTVWVGNVSGAPARTAPVAGGIGAPSFVTSAVQVPLYAFARVMYASTIKRQEVCPALIALWMSVIVASSMRNGFWAGTKAVRSMTTETNTAPVAMHRRACPSFPFMELPPLSSDYMNEALGWSGLRKVPG